MKTFLLLKHNGLLIFTDTERPQQLSFPPELVKYQEISDQKAFDTLLDTFFSQLSKDKTILFLSDEIVFAKKVVVNTEIPIEDERKKFIDLVPLPAGTFEIKTIQTESYNYFFATNSHIYTAIIAIADRYKVHITKVVPLLLFGNITNQVPPSFDIFSDIAKEKELLEKGNFLTTQSTSNKTNKTSIKQVMMLIVSLLILGVAILFGAVNLGFLSIPTQKEKMATNTKQVVTPTVKPVISPKVSASVSIKKEGITIQILNGSGITGQAGTIKKQLEEIGFTDIQIGNAEGPISNTTIAIFSKRVSKEYEEAILKELKKTFTNIETQQISETNKYDVLITTGEVK